MDRTPRDGGELIRSRKNMIIYEELITTRIHSPTTPLLERTCLREPTSVFQTSNLPP
jgi:hypothetical protein